MKAMLIKDLLILKSQLKSLLAVLFVWLVISFVNGSGLFFMALTVIYGMLLPLNTIAADEKNHFERYAMSMPVTRADLALSHYALGLLGIAALAVFGVGAGVVIGDEPGEAVAASLACSCIAVLLMSVTLPLVYKFGVERARIIAVAVYLVMFLAVGFMLDGLGIELDDLRGVFFLLPLLSLAVLAASAGIGVGLYRKREF